jgi:hypothetical protein
MERSLERLQPLTVEHTWDTDKPFALEEFLAHSRRAGSAVGWGELRFWFNCVQQIAQHGCGILIATSCCRISRVSDAAQLRGQAVKVLVYFERHNITWLR